MRPDDAPKAPPPRDPLPGVRPDDAPKAPPPRDPLPGVRLVNRRNGAVVAERVEQAVSMRARLKGLLGRSALAEGDALWIAPCTSIHTFFMKFSIDVAFVRGDGTVVRAIAAMRPWRATRIYPAAACAVELPAGALARSDTREGDRLELC